MQLSKQAATKVLKPQTVFVAKDISLEEGLLENAAKNPSDESVSDIPPPLPPKFAIGSEESLDDRRQPESSTPVRSASIDGSRH